MVVDPSKLPPRLPDKQGCPGRCLVFFCCFGVSVVFCEDVLCKEVFSCLQKVFLKKYMSVFFGCRVFGSPCFCFCLASLLFLNAFWYYFLGVFFSAPPPPVNFEDLCQTRSPPKKKHTTLLTKTNHDLLTSMSWDW